MSDTTSFKELRQLLTKQLSVQEEIYHVAKMVQDTALEKDVTGLSVSVQQQNGLIHASDELERRRKVCVEKIKGIPPREYSLRAVAAVAPPEEARKILSLRKKLKDAVQKNRSISTENSRIIEANLGAIQKDVEMIAGLSESDSGYTQRRKKISARRI
ncbi:flagellar export chaperone FlgN [Chitinivibrio alkaliphilus]|uniref:FlgK-, FlgL-specific chaperone FlgN n=1 Tax=Chitinivibrio alkaliphilus ACht1 TaxID=1313304 RepID=U7DEL3_9BACT|nr:flagellar export chaperone FlgN [Chitinivibrio alkaliphilus]ERP39376.1 FlgK-, FlgL-specific chaperone FlgN [Chitinivibrio alkaliphilus ACht1]